MGLDPMRRAVNTLMPGRDVALPAASFAGKKHESNQRRFENPPPTQSSGNCLSYDFSRREGEKERLGEGGSPLDSGEGRIGSTLTV
jgi:hypothetical protein